MYFCFLQGHISLNRYVGNRLNSQLANEENGRMKHFQFWMDFNALTLPTDLVSYGQVEAIE